MNSLCKFWNEKNGKKTFLKFIYHYNIDARATYSYPVNIIIWEIIIKKTLIFSPWKIASFGINNIKLDKLRGLRSAIYAKKLIRYCVFGPEIRCHTDAVEIYVYYTEQIAVAK